LKAIDVHKDPTNLVLGKRKLQSIYRFTVLGKMQQAPQVRHSALKIRHFGSQWPVRLGEEAQEAWLE
jgi:hypothetical protein